jgi:post-segregation antitoxin (ccd killing protein)
VRMARVNVYLPDALAASAREADLNVSRIVQESLADALAARDTDRWLDALAALDPGSADHDDVMAAIREARADLGDG